jgi:hypothetical protein
LLYSAKSIFSPFLSAQYFDYRSKNNFLKKPSLEDQFGRIGAYRIYGESEKEFVFVNESPVWQISAAETGHFSRFYSFILSRSKIIFHEGMQNTLDTLIALSLPGLSDSTRMILMTGALESLLIPDLKTQINAGFTKRFIHLCHNHSETDLAWMSLTYRIRSELIHGNRIESLLNRLPFDQSHYLIVLKQRLTISICKILQYIQSSVEFEKQLNTLQKSLSFDTNSDELKICMALMDYKGKQQVSHQWEI